MVDVGAHIGTYSVRGAKAVGDTGMVVSVEPNPETIEHLREGVAASGWRNIVIVPAACGDTRGRLKLFAASPRNTGMTSLARENAILSGSAAREFDVDVLPLDDIFASTKAQRLDVIKSDTEGAETMVMRGATGVIAKYHPSILVEESDTLLRGLNSSKAELEGILQSYGYRKANSDKANALWVPSQ